MDNYYNDMLCNSIQNDIKLLNQIKKNIFPELIKKRVQHVIWELLHSFSSVYPDNPTEFQKENTKELLLKIKNYMPFCMTCSNNGKDNFIENYNLDLAVSCGLQLIICLIEYHKFINLNFAEIKNYDNSLYTVEFIKNKYLDGKIINYLENTYKISFFDIITNQNINILKQIMNNFRQIVTKEIEKIDYSLSLSIVINE